MTKRPTDHLEPAPKKRSGDRQISKEDPASDSEGEPEHGEGFARADDTQLKKRKIFRARRAGQPAPAPTTSGVPAAASGTGSNPFAGISLTPAAAGNPFAGVSLAAPAAPKVPEAAGSCAKDLESAAAASEAMPASHAAAPAEEAREDAHPEEPAEAAKGESAPVQQEAAEDRGKASAAGSNAEEPAAPSGNAFASFAASNSKSGFGTLSADTARASSNSFGNGTSLGSPSFASFSMPPPASTPATTGFSFTPGTDTSFTFSTMSAPASSSFPAMASIFQQPSHPPSTGLFGSSNPPAAPAVSLPPEDSHRVTGEEEERSVYTGDGTLFEYDEAERQWRERGRGEMKVNVGARGEARLIMRNKGNFRLLLNANIWPGMTVTPMDGGKGVTFIVMNAVQLPADSKAGEEPEHDAGKLSNEGKMSTWAYRVKMASKLEDFTAAVNEHRVPVSAAEDNV